MTVRCRCWKPSDPHEATCPVVRDERRLFERLMTAASPRDHKAAPGPGGDDGGRRRAQGFEAREAVEGMSALSCRQCGKAIERRGTGPAPTYCGPACRKAASRGVSPRKPGPTVASGHLDESVTGSAPRPLSDAGTYGDGDYCPEGCRPGRMYVLGKERGGDARQWCPNSRHPGRALYLYDGTTPLTPASRSALDPTAESARGEPARGQIETPVQAVAPISPGASIPRPALEPDGLGRGAVQMHLPETAAPL